MQTEQFVNNALLITRTRNFKEKKAINKRCIQDSLQKKKMQALLNSMEHDFTSHFSSHMEYLVF